MNWQLLLGLIQVVSGVLRDTNVIDDDVAQWADLLSLGASLAERGDDAVEELAALKDQVEAIAARRKATGEGPTAEERAAWRTRSDAAHAALQALKGD